MHSITPNIRIVYIFHIFYDLYKSGKILLTIYYKATKDGLDSVGRLRDSSASDRINFNIVFSLLSQPVKKVHFVNMPGYTILQ